MNSKATSVHPMKTKYRAIGTADSSRELSNPGQPMAAMLDYTHVAQQIDRQCRIASPLEDDALEEILLHHFPNVASPTMQNRASRIKRHPDRRLCLHEWRHDELHRVDMHVQQRGPRLRQPVLHRSFELVRIRNRLAPE